MQEAATAGKDRHAELSTHQEFLGVSRSHSEATGALAKGEAIKTRLIGKQSVVKQREVAQAKKDLFDILLVCALAAWLEQTERWYCMPENPRRNLPMVCNHNAMQTRIMGAHVRHEHKVSSQSMFSHVCANCGRLLYSVSDYSRLPRETGVAGAACQLRGRITDWFSMPPFLLLWSKKALGRFLRAVMTYDDTKGTLTMKRGWLTAPWLHLKQHEKDVDVKKPWMYCTDCHEYMLPKDPAEGKRDVQKLQRIPMRSRQEALYTRWHQDLGFPHLRESVIDVFPALKDQLPSEEKVLEFH